jgi:hypothetical protein
MTKLTSTVRRETTTTYRGRPLCVELHAGFMVLRQKGRGDGGAFSVDYATVYEVAMKIAARTKMKESK